MEVEKSSKGTDVELKKILVNGIILAVVVGVMCSITLIASSSFIISNCFPLLEQDVVTSSLQYLRIRSMSVPAVLITDVVVGFSLGVQNSVGPMITISLAFVANVLCDLLFVGFLGYGLSGAAWATTIAAYVGSLVCLLYLVRKFQYQQLGRKGFSSIISLIDGALMKSFYSTGGSIFIGALLETFTYSTGARVASFAGGIKNIPDSAVSLAASTIDVAAHQIAMQTWWLLSYMSSPFALVGQALLPRDMSASKYGKVRYTIQLLLKIATLLGVTCSVVCFILPTFLPALFTDNATIQSVLAEVIPQVTCSQMLICLATVMDGIFIGTGGLDKYVMAGVFSTSCAFAFYVISMHNRWGLTGAWDGLLVFCFVRLLYYFVNLPTLVIKCKSMRIYASISTHTYLIITNLYVYLCVCVYLYLHLVCHIKGNDDSEGDANNV